MALARIEEFRDRERLHARLHLPRTRRLNDRIDRQLEEKEVL
jgi:hypothetical protein